MAVGRTIDDPAPSNPGSSIGIDVGGTFTDFVVALPDGSLVFHKEPSTPQDPSVAVQRGLEHLTGRHAALAGFDGLVVHGTTIGLNAILQGRVAPIALVVSTGNRDVLEIGRCRLPSAFDLHLERPKSLVPRDFVLEVGARISARGEVLARPTPSELDALCGHIRQLGVKTIALMLLNSYRRPDVEDEIAEAIRARMPNLLISQSSRIWPECREYERAVVACLNAQVHPLLGGYLSRLIDRIESIGASPSLRITSSAGGALTVRSARERPVDTLLSGPASGVVASVKLAGAAGIDAAITFDMGGTSADIALLRQGEVEFTTSAMIGSTPLMMPVIGVSAIGAGGGSIISVDGQGVIKVGPESAGAVPGPVAYGKGGTEPTVTDCFITLGIVDPAGFLGGRLRLDPQAAQASLQRIADLLHLPSPQHAAEAALNVATAGMASELFKLLAQKGLNASTHLLIPFGGAGPTQAVMLAEEAGLAGVAIPPAAATFCALGAIMADARRDFVFGLGQVPFSQFDAIVWDAWSRLEAEASAWLDSEGARVLRSRYSYALDMRYSGQSHNLIVDVPPSVRQARDISAVAECFHRAHEAIYDFREPEEAIEAMTLRLSIIGEMPGVRIPGLADGEMDPGDIRERPVFSNGQWRSARIYRRERIKASTVIDGPAIIEQDDTTIHIPGGWTLAPNEIGFLVVKRCARQ